MSRNLIIKLVVILGLIGLCLVEILPWEEKLKPGIDLAGGTSLIYSINTEGLTELDKRTVEEDMIRILRKRIDPSNKSNIIWRPHGGYRIEIQMPLATKETRARRDTFKNKEASLAGYNLDILRVRQGLIKPVGIEDQVYQERRSKNFDDLAESWRQRIEALVLGKGISIDDISAGAQRRRELLGNLSEAQDTNEERQTSLGESVEKETTKRDELSAAEVDLTAVDELYGIYIDLEPNQVKDELFMIVGDDVAKQDLITEYMDIRSELGFLRRATMDEETGSQTRLKAAWEELEQVNIDAGRLRMLLEASEGKPTPDLEELKGQHPLAAGMIDELVAAYGVYTEVEGRLDDPEDLKRLLRGAGVLEWRILPKSSPQPELTEAIIAIHRERLEKFGPDKWNSNEQYVWMKIKDPDTFQERAWTYCVDQGGMSYVLCSNLDGEVMRRDTAGGNWKLQNVRPATDNLGRPAVGFSFNQTGSGLFFNITKANKDRPLGILLDDEVISAPNIRTPILGSGIIEGSFTQQEVMDMVDKLNAGALPARLSDQPESENTIGPTLGASNLNAGLKAGF
ncbi:MAG: hypothetical protein AMJ79_09690, partial [Phycisphaerae bacterium SM23_30]